MQSAERAMQMKMEQIFSNAGKVLKYQRVRGGWWRVSVDGKWLGYDLKEQVAFQDALDKSGIGGKISYNFSESKQCWIFRYSAKKAATSAGTLGFGKYANVQANEVPASYRRWLQSHLNVLSFENRKAAKLFLAA